MKARGKCLPSTAMNDVFVSHNNSSGGRDMLNKVGHYVVQKACTADPQKERDICDVLKLGLLCAIL